jgi:hypothetical protein
LVAPVVFLITPRHGPRKQHCFSYAYPLPRESVNRAFSLAAAIYFCLLRICCLATDVVPLSVSLPLPNNECYFRAVR